MVRFKELKAELTKDIQELKRENMKLAAEIDFLEFKKK